MSSPLARRELGLAAGPALVLMHGNGDSSACWPDAARRWGRGYRVVAVDARGHGASPPFAADQLVEPGEVFLADALELLADLRADGHPVVGVGHSLGAGVLTGVLAAAPGLLTAAVLIDPPWDTPVVLGPRPEVGAGRVDFVREAQRDPGGALRRHREAHPEWSDDEHEGWLAAKQSLDLGYIGTGSGRLSTPWPDLLRGIADPTLVVTGERDCLVGAATRATVADVAADVVEVAVVPGADHYVRQSNPDAFHAVVDPWLAAHVADHLDDDGADHLDHHVAGHSEGGGAGEVRPPRRGRTGR